MFKENKKGKLNNRGFAITSIIYSMLLLFIVLMTLTILTLGRKKVLLDKTKNETLGFFSQLKDYPCTVTTKSSAEIDIGIGDVITCKTESFFVVSNDGTNIEMLAKYNLNVGENKIQDDTEGIQSAKAIGSNHIPPKYYSKASLSLVIQIIGMAVVLIQYMCIIIIRFYINMLRITQLI